MSENQKEQLFLQYRGLARKIASRLSKLHNRPYQQLCDIAEYALALELFGRQKHNSNKGKLSSWLYQVVYFHVIQVITRAVHPSPNYPGSKKAHVREWTKDIPMTSLCDEESPIETEARCNWLENLLREVSEEGAALLKIILSAPEEVGKALGNGNSKNKRQMAREAVRCHLIDNLDWSPDRLDRAWKDVCECL